MEPEDIEHESPLAIIEAWQDAANSQDLKRLLELSDPHIEVAGPRGSGHGYQLLRDWLGRAGLSVKTLRIFVRGNVAVLSQQGVWRSVETGEVTGERNIASRFQVQRHRVAQFARYDSLDVALQEAGLNYSDEKIDS